MTQFSSVAAITRALLLLACLFIAGCKSDLHTNLSEPDANEILAALLTNGISAKKMPGKDGFTVVVETRQFGAAVDLLRAYGLPKRRFSSVGDVFQSEGLVASPLQEWAKLNFAKEQELSSSISGIPGVIRADVHLGEARKDSPFEEVEPPSASVLIQMDENMISDRLVPEVKQLVSLAHPAIEYDRVGVVITPVVVQQAPVQFSEVGGVLVHTRDVNTVYYVLALSVGMSVLCVISMGGVAYLWRKRKLMEANS